MDNYNFAQAACNILIVEDSPTQAERLRFMLEQKGCRVASAENGFRALELMRAQRPDIVISDVVMPGMDGYELCRNIRETPEFEDLPVILLTSLVNPNDIIRGLEVGATNFITKPYERDYLFSCLNAIMMNRALEAHEGLRMGLDVYFSGARHTITAERKQILGLLLTTFETAVHKNAELVRIEEELRELNEQLEQKVHQRTESLTAEVTERRRLEAQHEALATKLELVLNLAAEGIFGISVDHKCTFVNATAADLLGYTQEEMLGMDMTRLWRHPDNSFQPDADQSAFALENHSVAARKAKAILVRKDGTTFPARYTASRLDEGQPDAMVVVTFMNIADEVAAESKIITQLNQLDALHNIDVSITAGLDLRITLETTLRMYIRELKVDAGTVYLEIPQASQKLERYAVAGFQGKAVFDREIKSTPEIFLPAVVGTGSDLFMGAVSREPFWTEEQFVDYYRIPLYTKGYPCGVLELFRRVPIHRDKSWTEYANTLARHAMIAIDNYQLWTRLEKTNADLVEAYEETIEGWSRAMDLRDHETEGHTQRVAAMTLYLARRMGYHDEQLVHIRRGALLHDIGKMGVPDQILLKPGTLTEEEWRIMKMHPQYAYDLLYPISYLRPALDIPYCHHEKWDGTGYPRGLKGEDIPKVARLFAVADIWDALQSDRPYRAAWSPEQIREHIRSLSGNHLEPSVVDAFLQIDLQQIGALLDYSPNAKFRVRRLSIP